MGHPRVIVSSDQALVAESVRAALSSHGYPASVLRWPPATVTTPSPGLEGLTSRTDVLLVVSDLVRPVQLQAAVLVLSSLPVPRMVLTDAPAGPAWGAMLEAGADLVVSTSTSLDELTGILDEVATRSRCTAPASRLALVAAWDEARAERLELMARLSSLTPREAEVLRHLYAGESVRTIAESSEVSRATVRSQVKAVLRKLDVKSQLSAVAALRFLDEWSEPRRTGAPVEWDVIDEITTASAGRRSRGSGPR